MPLPVQIWIVSTTGFPRSGYAMPQIWDALIEGPLPKRDCLKIMVYVLGSYSQLEGRLSYSGEDKSNVARFRHKSRSNSYIVYPWTLSFIYTDA